MAYFDTSVIAAYYCPEELSDQAEELLVSDDKPMISLLTVTEFASVLSRKIRERAVTKATAQKIWARFEMHRSQGHYHTVSINHEHFNHAVGLITRFDNQLRTLDAIHLAVADVCGVAIVTADVALARAGEMLGVGVVRVGCNV